MTNQAVSRCLRSRLTGRVYALRYMGAMPTKETPRAKAPTWELDIDLPWTGLASVLGNSPVNRGIGWRIADTARYRVYHVQP